MEGDSKRAKSSGATKKDEAIADIEDCHGGHVFTQPEVRQIQTLLIEWYGKNKRDLPWREKREEDSVEQRAYRVWVSEVMLQQTQVATVVPYFGKFMVAFPTITALAAAEDGDVKQIWSGLGFYRRASNLHAAAKQVVDTMDGRLPTTKEGLLKLKGVGMYTAGAISSIVFGLEEPIVDGNVVRVVSRLRAIGGSPKSRQAVAKHWELASALVKGCGDPSSLNQALMELGATVCTKGASPKCSECPVREFCVGRESVPTPNVTGAARCEVCGDWEPPADVQGPARFPAPKPKIAKRDSIAYMVVLETIDGEFVLQQRPSTGLLAGMKQFPTLDAPDRQAYNLDRQAEARKSLLKMCFEKTSSRGHQVRSLGSFQHKFSHINQTVYVEHIKMAKAATLSDGLLSVAGDQISKMGVAKSTNKAYTIMLNPKKPRKKQKLNDFRDGGDNY